MLNMRVKSDEIACLIQIMLKNPLIKRRFSELMQLNSFERRFALNICLEQLRQRDASDNLLYVLGILFDDIIAKKVLSLINNCHN